MKKILMIICGAIIFLNSCKKAVNDTVPGGNTLLLAYPAGTNYNTLSSGLNYFDNGLMNLDKDTILVSANIARPLSKDLVVTIATDQTAFTNYNNNTANHTKYTLMPQTYYSIVNNTATITAGQTAVVFKIAINASQFDISQTGYMLPVTITNAAGQSINNNMKTVYLHIEKDPFPPYPRNNWLVTGFSSQEAVGEGPNNGHVIQVIDNDPSTFWHSQWMNPPLSATTPPHWFSFDMAAQNVIHGVMFLTTQGRSDHRPKDVNISVSNDGGAWTTAANITLESVATWQKIPITPTQAVRYLKVTINTTYDSQAYTNLAEFKAY
ncbi:BT_3987 domain-containing protein [Mucilaginibacter sp. FT3.2]|uniref:BT_3987 domain-containing protein n=1 Tax=Mucilaginibacter sp. FT3.2 TaxID=2723090 RepID=UPI001621E5A3|nr:DUF1735 domain-containing protein [Mucilaginibacter sp. FT3.2]MBB6232921.1 hypothetical protein [Mucilaginibacter sp. FT3.2]